MTMGGDFSYSVASSWFRNMDKLIKYGFCYYAYRQSRRSEFFFRRVRVHQYLPDSSSIYAPCALISPLKTYFRPSLLWPTPFSISLYCLTSHLSSSIFSPLFPTHRVHKPSPLIYYRRLPVRIVNYRSTDTSRHIPIPPRCPLHRGDYTICTGGSQRFFILYQIKK